MHYFTPMMHEQTMKHIHGMTPAENQHYRNRERAENICLITIVVLLFSVGFILADLVSAPSGTHFLLEVKHANGAEMSYRIQSNKRPTLEGTILVADEIVADSVESFWIKEERGRIMIQN